MRTRPLERIEALSQEEREQLAEWLLTETLDRTGELMRETFGVEIPRSTLHRYRKRCEATDYLDRSEDSARARAELIEAAASGRPNFCQATVDLLEKQVFDLAHGHRDPGAMEALKTMFGLITDHRDTMVRERMAAVQEQKMKLRQEERLGKNAHDGNGVTEDELGLYAATLDEIEARAAKKFRFSSRTPKNGRQMAATEKAEEIEDLQESEDFSATAEKKQNPNKEQSHEKEDQTVEHAEPT